MEGDSVSMVLVLSEHADRSKHVQREVGHAFENSITVIPFRISEMQPSGTLGYYLRSVQWPNACAGKMESHLAALSVKVRELLYKNESGTSHWLRR